MVWLHALSKRTSSHFVSARLPGGLRDFLYHFLRLLISLLFGILPLHSIGLYVFLTSRGVVNILKVNYIDPVSLAALRRFRFVLDCVEISSFKLALKYLFPTDDLIDALRDIIRERGLQGVTRSIFELFS